MSFGISLIEVCLPVGQPTAPFAITTDQDSITISSANPNLRVISGQAYPTLAATAPNLPPRQVQAVTFLVTTSTSYVQVAHYQGRYFLRDGNHRAAALLLAGITQVPAIVIEAPTFQYVAPPPLGLFDYQVAFSNRPPLVTDFWDTSVAAGGHHPATYKVVRVSAAQFPVPIHA
ncbi:ParB-like nuclease domain-containing protein [Actinocrinis puniceicyclus]|uniref:ParB-like nuclease domain-containing protein n=1 Tax=Actinocrinis puniceicyclus TaxID=977794 RepID=A0A8J8BF53_9ACTN|nr:ParB N-terminal domain-containing protein [Actinocrinis puniceicyclus]MBS2965826.1 ParB-like nuclease domain-containing protein [Actinocrinis puniceicyclus]